MKEHYLKEYQDYLRVRNLAERTIKTYSSIVRRFLDFCNEAPEFVSDHEMLKFILNGGSSRTREQMIGALQHFYFGVLHQPKKFKFVPKVKREEFIPNILTMDEAKALIASYKNKKHKAIIALIYYGAFRISEATNIKVSDINKEGIAKINQSKGAKDRLVPLAKPCIEILREYYKTYRPNEYLFAGQNRPRYSSKSIQNVLVQGLTRIGVKRHIRVHDLRHSRATHWLDQGVSIEHIRMLLGHRKIETTQRYTHTSVVGLKTVLASVE